MVVLLLLSIAPDARVSTNSTDEPVPGRVVEQTTNTVPGKATGVDKAAIDSVVAELGHPEFARRKAALARAETFPADAFKALMERLRHSEDPELRHAAGVLSGWVPARIAGEFNGTVLNAGVFCRVQTTVAWDGKSLTGKYEITEPTGPAGGILSQFKSIGDGIVTCRWQDKYGVGDLRMSFSPDYTSFTGTYSTDGREGSDGSAQWNGAR